MTQLRAQAPLSQSRVSRLVAELEAHALVSRTGAVEDTRRVLVSITDAGLTVLRAAQDTHHDGLRDRLYTALSPRDLGTLARLTRAILAANEAADTGARGALSKGNPGPPQPAEDALP